MAAIPYTLYPIPYTLYLTPYTLYLLSREWGIRYKGVRYKNPTRKYGTQNFFLNLVHDQAPAGEYDTVVGCFGKCATIPG
jgi:hypothetical protein